VIDIGTNLANKAFRRDLDDVLRRARAAGVEAIVTTGTSEPASRAVWEIAERLRGPDQPRVACTAGIHPHHARDLCDGSIGALRALAARREVVAIGECGLDFDRNFSPREAQLRCFEAQLDLAAELRMPVFLHERAAHDEFLAIMKRWRPRLVGGVVHCFTGTEVEALRYLDLDLHLGVTGFLCDERRGAHLAGVVRRIPRDRLMIETDAPYLLPRTMPRHERPKDGRNEPAFLRHVLAAVAEARGEPADEVERATVAATARFFDLPG
jgi:TatD DNase family protein